MSDKYPDKSLKTIYNFLWLGFLLYVSSYVVAQSDKVNYILINVFQIIGLLMLIPAAVMLAVGISMLLIKKMTYRLYVKKEVFREKEKSRF